MAGLLAGQHRLRPRRRPRPAARAPGRERGGAAAFLRAADRSRAREPPHHAGRRMAARQFLPDRRADPHRAAPSAASATAASCRAWRAARPPACRASTTSRWKLISHGDGRVDAESLDRFVAAYQSVAPLKLGELWAIPIMLRLALIENLRRVAVARSPPRDATATWPSDWAERMMDVAEQQPTRRGPGAGRHGALGPAADQRVRGRADAAACRGRARLWRCR